MLLELPAELLVYAASLLGGRDVLALAATCTDVRATLSDGGRQVPWPPMRLTNADDDDLDALAKMRRRVTSVTLRLGTVTAARLANLHRLLPDLTGVTIYDTQLPEVYTPETTSRVHTLRVVDCHPLGPYLCGHPGLTSLDVTYTRSGTAYLAHGILGTATTAPPFVLRRLAIHGNDAWLNWDGDALLLENLEALECDGNTHDDSNAHDYDNVVVKKRRSFPNLASLVVRDTSLTFHRHYGFPSLHWLDMPNLTTLVVETECNDVGWFYEPLAAGWGPRLTSVRVPLFADWTTAVATAATIIERGEHITNSHATLRSVRHEPARQSAVVPTSIRVGVVFSDQVSDDESSNE
jgi:hypothetical protein